MKVLAIIPAYNEESNIYNVVTAIKNEAEEVDILVINDGSKDDTGKEAIRAGAKAINMPYNLGIGGAVQTGYIYAIENNYDIAIQVDGDGQHNPNDIERIIKPIIEGKSDMVIGSRFKDKTDYKPSFCRNLGIMFFSKLVSTLCRAKYYDTTSGYRAINRSCMELFCNYYPKDYPEVETIVYACKNGMRITEISVDMNYRKAGKSSITPLRSVYYMLKVTFCTIFMPN